MKRKRELNLLRLVVYGVITPLDYYKYKRMRENANLNPAYRKRVFDLSCYTNDECLKFFRFTKFELHQLEQALQLPKLVKFKKTTFSGQEGLCILLRRLTYPKRLADLVKEFRRSGSSISYIVKWMLQYIYTHFGSLVSSLEQDWMTLMTLPTFSNATKKAGSHLPKIVGFIDGTGKSICRPVRKEMEYYSGHKKQHLIKYQTVVFPNGLISRLDGPFYGRPQAAILGLSGIRSEMENFLKSQRNSNYSFYGDPGYAKSKFVKSPFKNSEGLTSHQLKFNRDMAGLRVSAEYGFGKILQQFPFLDYKKNPKVLLQKLKLQYHVAAILVNFQCCLRGNQISEYFQCNPPSLLKYVSHILTNTYLNS